MIELTCTNCRRILEIDDAFAGGVCRCQYCGTIQTVPAHLKGSTRPAAPPVVAGQKALLKGDFPVDQSGSGLDELAQAVASSGLSGPGLKTKRQIEPPAAQAPAAAPAAPLPKSNLLQNRKVLIAAGSVAGVVLGIILVAVLSRGGGKPNPPAQPSPTTPGQTPTAAQNTTPTPTVKPNPDTPTPRPALVATGPNFMGIGLKGPTAIFLLDHGSGTRETFDAMRGGAVRAMASLGSGIRFQIIFWETDGLIVAPKDGLALATPEHIASCTEELKNIACLGQSKIESALEKALSENPAEIVIVTGKYVEESFAKSVLDAAKGKPVKVHTISLGASGSKDVLKSIADQTGGQFVELLGLDLSDYEKDAP